VNHHGKGGWPSGLGKGRRQPGQGARLPSVSEHTCVQPSRVCHPTIVMLLQGLFLCLSGLMFRNLTLSDIFRVVHITWTYHTSALSEILDLDQGSPMLVPTNCS
jgi:hypothetical protein